jgi:hypothetical protein
MVKQREIEKEDILIKNVMKKAQKERSLLLNVGV